ncbi:MAG: ketopantoate reductase family protein [Acidimicrobiales bacterium]
MRYVVFGAGAIGGGIGGRLAQHGHDVTLIARGKHRDAIRDLGLRVADPEGDERVAVPVVEHPGEVELIDGDVVIIAVKSQDTDVALRDLAAVAPPSISVACAQNGVENERLAARRFEFVYGVLVVMPATHLEPGEVLIHTHPISGILDVGRYPSGSDKRAEQIVADLSASTFSSFVDPRIMRAKYGKLLLNLGNAIEALTGERSFGVGQLYERARTEAEACYAAAGIDAGTAEDDRARRGELMHLRPAGGRTRSKGSSWQSLARGKGSIEVDHLNGEISLLGRLHGVATPVNAALQRIANRAAREGVEAGSMSIADLTAAVDRLVLSP